VRIITVQPADRTDQLTADGTELTQRPYPFHVVADTGEIIPQEFWKGHPARAVGFAARLDIQQIDLWWVDAARDPQRAVGMYLVTENTDGGMDIHQTAVMRMTEKEI
jgi:hypothetical protein